MPFLYEGTYNADGNITNLASTTFKHMGAIFGLVEVTKRDEDGSKKSREYVKTILGELIPKEISLGCKSNNQLIPIPGKDNIYIRMGFQGHTLHIIAILHRYPESLLSKRYPFIADFSSIKPLFEASNFYDVWKENVTSEKLIKVLSTSDTDEAGGPLGLQTKFGDPRFVDLDDLYTIPEGYPYTSCYTVLPEIKPGTYWYVRNINIERDASSADNYRMEIDLMRSWAWKSTNRSRPSFDIDCESAMSATKATYSWPSDYMKDRTEQKGD